MNDDKTQQQDGPCRVWHETRYCRDRWGVKQGPPDHWAEDEDGEIHFANRAAARAYIDAYLYTPSQYDGYYTSDILEHNQYASDLLSIVFD